MIPITEFKGRDVAVFGLAAGYFRLQVLQHEEYRTRSEANRIKPRPIVPARGLIYDRNGRLLADNVPAYRLEIVPEQVPQLEDTLKALGALVRLDDEDLARFRETRRATRSFRPIPLKLRLDEGELARLAVEECGLPKGVLNIVTGTGAEAGTALVAHPAIRKIAFTGSLRAGKLIGQAAAERIIPVTLELGGKSPNIVFADADLSKAVPGSPVSVGRSSTPAAARPASSSSGIAVTGKPDRVGSAVIGIRAGQPTSRS